MTLTDLLHYRLCNQQIARHDFATSGEVVSWLGAIQAQDYPGAKWSIGLRLPGSTEADIDRAIAAKTIVRTWPMRGTLHFVAAADIKWMLQLLTPRVVSGMAGRHRQLGLDDKTLAKSRTILVKALQGGKQVARNILYDLLAGKGIDPKGQRGIHILCTFAMQGLLCFGSHDGKQPTFALLDEWVPNAKTLPRDEALANIALRYFTGHGPATLKDFIWWTGLTVKDAKEALTMIMPQLEEVVVYEQSYYFNTAITTPPVRPSTPLRVTGKTKNIIRSGARDVILSGAEGYLLPGFDEYMLGYTNRSVILDPLHMPKIVPGNNGMFMPTVILNGRVEGTWKRTVKKDNVEVKIIPFMTFGKTQQALITKAAKGYGAYVGQKAVVI